MNHQPSDSKASKAEAAFTAEAMNGFGSSEEFDRIATLVGRIVGAPVCLVTVNGEEHQLILGARGLPPNLEKSRRIPSAGPIYEKTTGRRDPLVVRDATNDQRMSGEGPIAGLEVAAYLGYPLVGHEGEDFGTFCVIDNEPREWTEWDIETVREFTALVARHVDLGILRARQQSSLDVVIHDLKSPLSGIQMISGLLGDQVEQLPPPLQPLTASLSESVDKAMNLVISLGKRDTLGSERGCADPESIVRERLARLRPVAEEKSVTVDLTIADLPLPVEVANWVVEQVAENLLSNAIKFTPVGGGVHVTSRRDGGSWVFEVSDDGPGFTAEDRAHLYRRYARLSAKPTAGEPSSGLGLSIVKRLVDQEGGAIELESEPGRGATFRVSFPLA